MLLVYYELERRNEMFKAGYKFKEDHEQIHYVRVDHGVCGDEYEVNFARSEEVAEMFVSREEARACVLSLMANFERDHDYRWTPVIVDLETGKLEMIIDSRWH